jgi:hypothetical protein
MGHRCKVPEGRFPGEIGSVIRAPSCARINKWLDCVKKKNGHRPYGTVKDMADGADAPRAKATKRRRAGSQDDDERGGKARGVGRIVRIARGADGKALNVVSTLPNVTTPPALTPSSDTEDPATPDLSLRLSVDDSSQRSQPPSQSPPTPPFSFNNSPSRPTIVRAVSGVLRGSTAGKEGVSGRSGQAPAREAHPRRIRKPPGRA